MDRPSPYSGFFSIWPVLRTYQCSLGKDLPATLRDSHDKFGDTALMRGYGAVVAGNSTRHVVFISNYLELNAKLQMQSMAMGKIKFFYKGEVDAVIARTSHYTLNRAWENWARRAGREMKEMA